MAISRTAVGVVVLLASAAGGAGLLTTGHGPPIAPFVNPTQPPPPVVTGTLTFDGVDVSTASPPASAIPVDLGSSIPVEFQWSARGGKLGEPGLVAVAAERLEGHLLGSPLLVNDHPMVPSVLSASGWANYSVSFASYRWVAEGMYAMTGALIAPNGTTLWSLGFYVHVMAPFHATVVNVVAVAVAAYLVAVVLLRPGHRRRPREERPRDAAPSPAPGPDRD
jgi:hypothetical protein